jgi:SAM-dependent methyltransferase
VIDGVPRLLANPPSASQRSTAEAFTWHGQLFGEPTPEDERHLLDVIAPLDPSFFEDKVVLDAGCGVGRQALLIRRFGAREVWAMDLGDIVATARQVLADVDGTHVVQGDLLNPPFARAGDGGGFDLVLSIGVLHHLPDPRAGVLALSELVRPGGTLFVWVYSAENARRTRSLIEALRRVTTRLPRRVLPVLTWPLATVVWLTTRITAVVGETRPDGRTPLLPHLSSIAHASLRRTSAVVADQLVAPTTHYISRPQLLDWFRAAGLDEVELSLRNGNSWRARGVRASRA